MSDTIPNPAVPRKKRLAVFLDGTWNTVNDNTNVWRLKFLLAANSSDGTEQLSFYSTSVGTAFGERARGGMFGYGLNEEIIRAYEWLIDHYNICDELFIFGFSRGAYGRENSFCSRSPPDGRVCSGTMASSLMQCGFRSRVLAASTPSSAAASASFAPTVRAPSFAPKESAKKKSATSLGSRSAAQAARAGRSLRRPRCRRAPLARA
jgi:hypothetical protein